MPHKFFDPVPGDTARRTVPTLLFSNPSTKGVWIGGEILSIDDTRFLIDPPTREIKKWPNTEIPIPILIIDLLVDGAERALWLRKDQLYTSTGEPYLGTMYRALCDVMAEAGMPKELPFIGDELWVRWIREEPTGPRGATRKIWEMKYLRPKGVNNHG